MQQTMRSSRWIAHAWCQRLPVSQETRQKMEMDSAAVSDGSDERSPAGADRKHLVLIFRDSRSGDFPECSEVGLF